ncbi:MAG: hypothetical protein M3150_03550 [Pseudomonadota bacterium]|nr:hypothetical protein [Pseudomonadota bacterium]
MSALVDSRRRSILRGAGAIAALGIAPVGRAFAAAPQSVGSAPQIGLAYEPHSRSLLKADATGAQAQVNGGWQALALGVRPGRGRVSAVSVAAGGKGIVYVAGPGLGVLRSEAGMRGFSPRNHGLASVDVIAMTAHAERPDTVYAYIAGRGIFRSEDGGLRWRLMDAGPRGGFVQFVHSNLPGSMQSGWLFAAGPNGVSRAMDCFCGWRDAGGLERAVNAVAYEPLQPANVHAATDSGLLSSSDGGETWTSAAAPPAATKALAAGPASVLYAASADGDVFRRATAAAAWEPTGA